MKKLILISAVLFSFNGWADNPERIYPAEGFFRDNSKTYYLDCQILWNTKNKKDWQEEYRIEVNFGKNYLSLQDYFGGLFTERRLGERYSTNNDQIIITENNSSTLAFRTNGEGRRDRHTYYLFRDRGYFGVSSDSSGNCIEDGYRWIFNPKKNTLTYQIDPDF